MAHVFLLADGKVKQHGTFASGMARAMQLGLLPPGQAKAEERAEEKGDTKGGKKPWAATTRGPSRSRPI